MIERITSLRRYYFPISFDLNFRLLCGLIEGTGQGICYAFVRCWGCGRGLFARLGLLALGGPLAARTSGAKVAPCNEGKIREYTLRIPRGLAAPWPLVSESK